MKKPIWFNEALEFAEKIAEKIDMLRVDIIVKEKPGGNNEMLLLEVADVPGIGYGSAEDKITQSFHDGYKNMCIKSK